MSFTEIVVEGTLKPDGTLELNERPNLPAGRVQVIVQSLPELPKDDPFWQRMQALWNAPNPTGGSAQSAEDSVSEVRQMRDEWEEHQQTIERLQEECREIEQTQERLKR